MIFLYDPVPGATIAWKGAERAHRKGEQKISMPMPFEQLFPLENMPEKRVHKDMHKTKMLVIVP